MSVCLSVCLCQCLPVCVCVCVCVHVITQVVTVNTSHMVYTHTHTHTRLLVAPSLPQLHRSPTSIPSPNPSSPDRPCPHQTLPFPPTPARPNIRRRRAISAARTRDDAINHVTDRILPQLSRRVSQSADEILIATWRRAWFSARNRLSTVNPAGRIHMVNRNGTYKTRRCHV